MDILYNKIQEIRIKPGIYLGEKSLHLLQAYLNGYVAYHNEINEPNYFFLPKFQDYITKWYGMNTTHSWADLITFHSSSDNEAFDRFYHLVEEFFKDDASI